MVGCCERGEGECIILTQMILYMTVEKPCSGVVSVEADYRPTHWRDSESVFIYRIGVVGDGFLGW